MFSNPMFYIFLTAMITMFVIISFVRNLSIPHSWLVAVFVGTLAEFVIMTGGYIFIDGRERIPELAITSLIVLAVGAVLYFIFQDLDYARIERVQFEDDDYYYYVKAVPKIRLAMEDKQVVNITAEEPEQEPEPEQPDEERSTSEE
jgi:ABC-type transport system involved in cytochrome c biogenesis permease subunit